MEIVKFSTCQGTSKKPKCLDPDLLASLVNSIDPNQLASEEAS